MFFRDWKQAHAAAVKLARELGKEVALEKFKEYNTPGFRVFSLPAAKFRQGFELRCEVVAPTDPI